VQVRLNKANTRKVKIMAAKRDERVPTTVNRIISKHKDNGK